MSVFVRRGLIVAVVLVLLSGWGVIAGLMKENELLNELIVEMEERHRKAVADLEETAKKDTAELRLEAENRATLSRQMQDHMHQLIRHRWEGVQPLVEWEGGCIWAERKEGMTFSGQVHFSRARGDEVMEISGETMTMESNRLEFLSPYYGTSGLISFYPSAPDTIIWVEGAKIGNRGAADINMSLSRSPANLNTSSREP